MTETSLDNLRSAIVEGMKKASSGFSFKAFLGSLVLERNSEGKLMIVVPSTFVAERYEREFRSDIEAIIAKATDGQERTFVIECRDSGKITEPEDSEVTPLPASQPVQQIERTQDMCGLNPKYTMSCFIVGDSNRFAHAVSMAVTASPGDTYNPLFLYGGVGLGKTHLMQAVGHKLIELGNLANGYLAYETSETFCNEYIQAIQSNSIDKFRKKYRQAGALLIDDVHFFGGKEKLQEEFFHTFNEMYQAGRQIVMTSDRPPIMLEHLQERLVSRFKSGVVADIKRPDLETRIAILKTLSGRYGLETKYECLEYIAEKVTENIRELEGAFTKIVAMASVMGLSITIPMIEEVLTDFAQEKRTRTINLDLIKKIVCSHFEIKLEEITGKRRLRKLVVPRQVAMYLSHDMTEETLQSIGASFGGRDHTTVLHAYNKIQRELNEGADLSDDVKMIRIKLKETVSG